MRLERDFYHIQKRKPGQPNRADINALEELAKSLDASLYLRSIGDAPFQWQTDALTDRSKHIIIDGCRQAGKSTVMSGKVCHHAKYFPKSLSVILAPVQRQAQEDMEKVKGLIAQDPHYPKLLKSNDSEIKLENGARILVVTATDDAARGFSHPDIVLFDEASRIDKSVFEAVKPMITGNKNAQIIEISTPNGKKSFFWEHWQRKRGIKKYLVVSPWHAVETPDGLDLVPRDMDNRRAVLLEHSLPEDDPCTIYESSRHEDYDEQLSNLIDERMIKYQQEFECVFVDAEDQVFRQNLIECLFEQRGDMDPQMHQSLMELPMIGEQDEIFKGEYKAQ